MKIFPMVALLVLLGVIFVVAAENENTNNQNCNYVRNYKSGEKKCTESYSVTEWTLIKEDSEKCKRVKNGCVNEDK